MSNYKKTGLAILCILSIIGIIFCRLHVHDRWIEMTPPKPSDEEIQRLIKCVVNDGDIDSYNELSRVYGSKALSYAIFMANEHHYGKACYDVYRDLISVYPLSVNANEETARLAIAYLKKGADMGDISCYSGLCTEYAVGRYLPLDSAQVYHYAYMLHKDSVEAMKHTQLALLSGLRVRKILK